MDALALLCNLYGDGPATLRRLREAGCGELADVNRVSVDELAAILQSSSVAARRFQSEAALLTTRAGKSRETDAVESKRSAAAASAAITAPSVSSAMHELASSRDPAIERALAAWRAADAAAETADDCGADEFAEHDERADERDRARDRDGDRASSGEADDRSGPQWTPLRPALVDGLDAALCTRLRAAGVENAEELVTADLLDLSSVCETPLTRLMRIQGHVRRLVAAETPGLLVPHPRRADARFSPDPIAVELRERGRPESEPGSGPFA
ncbi:MAG: hypothetical protein HZA52_14705 [Planctomycetes bacterium]|nr:hypothetical protein [Planctomycetota bacterium]